MLFKTSRVPGLDRAAHGESPGHHLVDFDAPLAFAVKLCPRCAGTGGIVDLETWRNIHWQRIDALTGGTLQFTTGLGLSPWYLKDYSPPKLPGALSPPRDIRGKAGF